MENVIVDYSHGDFSVYKATLENAKEILSWHEDNIDKKAIDIANKKISFVIKESIVNIVNKILNQEVDTMASKTIKVTKEAKQETVMYCFEKNIEIKNNLVNSHSFFNEFKLIDLSYFANNEKYPIDSVLVDDYVSEQARSYSVIKNDIWKENATEKAKINYVLNFCNELSSRDYKYEMVEVKENI